MVLGVIAYTLIRAERRRVKELTGQINKFKFVVEAIPVYGEYDLIVKTKTDSMKELNSLIYNRLRTISGVLMTTTMITADIDKK